MNGGAFAGHLTWWVNETGQTASLEAVATVPEYRRRGVMRRAIREGLNMLEAEGVQYAYVSTGARNPARFLYEGVGFAQLGKTYLYEKRL
jgi:ribosomal protein S18 acetylase RimI-like enzyme